MFGWADLPQGKRLLVIGWVAVLLTLYSVVVYFSLSAILSVKTASNASHAAILDSNKAESGISPHAPPPEGGELPIVKIGIYLDSIDNFSIRDSFWSAVFYVWFRWDGTKDLNPGKFVLVDGKFDKKVLMEEYYGEGGVCYQRYRVAAKLIKSFDTRRVPVEDHLLTIHVEDYARDRTRLRYIPDESSNISSRVFIPGFKITGVKNIVKNHTYSSSYGDPRQPENERKTFTQFVYGISIKRTNFGLYFKLFLGLYAASVLTLSSFFIRPTDAGPRFALPTAAYFGAVANTYVANSILPTSGTFGTMDYIYGIGLFTIFITIAESVFSLYLVVQRDDKPLAKIFDRLTFFIAATCYISANILIPLSASN